MCACRDFTSDPIYIVSNYHNKISIENLSACQVFRTILISILFNCIKFIAYNRATFRLEFLVHDSFDAYIFRKCFLGARARAQGDFFESDKSRKCFYHYFTLVTVATQSLQVYTCYFPNRFLSLHKFSMSENLPVAALEQYSII